MLKSPPQESQDKYSATGEFSDAESAIKTPERADSYYSSHSYAANEYPTDYQRPPSSPQIPIWATIADGERLSRGEHVSPPESWKNGTWKVNPNYEWVDDENLEKQPSTQNENVTEAVEIVAMVPAKQATNSIDEQQASDAPPAKKPSQSCKNQPTKPSQSTPEKVVQSKPKSSKNEKPAPKKVVPAKKPAPAKRHPSKKAATNEEKTVAPKENSTTTTEEKTAKSTTKSNDSKNENGKISENEKSTKVKTIPLQIFPEKTAEAQKAQGSATTKRRKKKAMDSSDEEDEKKEDEQKEDEQKEDEQKEEEQKEDEMEENEDDEDEKKPLEIIESDNSDEEFEKQMLLEMERKRQERKKKKAGQNGEKPAAKKQVRSKKPIRSKIKIFKYQF